MAVNKARTIAGILGVNSLVSYDSDIIDSSYNQKGAVSGGTLSLYSSADSLPGTAPAGTKALVTSTNRLYIYNSGWYNIAIINNFNPQWVTQPSGTYTLAIDGTTTTITVLATDSDDVPITYTATTDSDFDAIATITHDSDKHSVWTVTPTDSENGAQIGGTGTVTFKASDGVNLVQAASTFTLAFSTNWATATITSNTFYSFDPSSSGQSVGYFGQEIRLTKDNTRLFTSGPDGSAKGVFFIYKRNGSTYSNEAQFYPGFNNSGNLPTHNNSSGANFAYYFDIDDTGERAVAAWQSFHTGSYSNHGALLVLKRTGTSWASESGFLYQNQYTNNAYFGYRVCMDGSGTYVVGFRSHPTTSAGAGHLYKRTGTSWSYVGSFVGSGAAGGDQFGLTGGRMDATGTRIAVLSKSSTGKLWIMRRDSTNFSNTELATSDLGTVNQVSINGDGSYVAVGNGTDKEVYIYNRSGTTWSLQATIGPVTQTAGGTTVYKFGASVDLDYNGETIVIGNRDSGPSTIWIYKRTGSSWAKVKEIDESAQDANDTTFKSFGEVAINGDADTLAASGWYVNVTGSGQAGRGILKTYAT